VDPHNDRVRLLATALNNLGVAIIITGIVAPTINGTVGYLGNGGALEHAQSMAAHESPRTTKLYDRTQERLTQDEVERIRL
jgi:hypothetical protein